MSSHRVSHHFILFISDNVTWFNPHHTYLIALISFVSPVALLNSNKP